MVNAPAKSRSALRSPDQAGRLLISGQLVVTPTETVFGIAADAAHPEARARLWALLAPAGAPRPVLAWHAPDADRVRSVVSSTLGRALPAVHARVLERLTPGPVLLAFALPAPALDAARTALRLPAQAGVIDDGKELLVRVPSHPVAEALLHACGPGATVVMAGVAAPAGQRLRSTDEALAVIAALHPASGEGPTIDAAVEGPPAPLGQPSTLIRLTLRGPDDPRGAYEVARDGVYDRAYVERRLARRVLFVCTGNTCRSPMAAALARAALPAPIPGDIPTIIDSAGVSAYPGAPATPEGVEALRHMGVKMGPHASKPLTREMLRDADAVFAMTRAHAHAAADIDTGSADKVRPLDPSGGDIDDPIGSPLNVYESTARAVRGHIEARFRELGLITPN